MAFEHSREEQNESSSGRTTPQDADRSSRRSPSDEEKAKAEENVSKLPVNFLHSDLRQVWKEVLLKWGAITLLLSVFILAILSLYWAVQFRVYQNMASLAVYVVDFDGLVPPYDQSDAPPLVGPAVVETVQKMLQLPQPPNRMTLDSPPPHLGYQVRQASEFNNDPQQIYQAIYNYKAWAAIIINANATALLRQAVAQGNNSYDPLGAAQTVYVQARDETTIGNYVQPSLSMLQSSVQTSFGPMWTKMTLETASENASMLQNLQKAPQALNPAIGFSTFNLRPFSPPGATPAVSIGLIYLIILSFFSFSFYLPIHMKLITPKGHRPLHFWQLITWRWVSTLTAYLFLSLAYSLISLAFQIPFSNSAQPAIEVANNPNAFGHASFVVYWMLNYVGMAALGLACENVAMVVGMPWTALWLIFWVITNVTTSFYEIALAPHFYYWGYAWPLHNIVEASRTIIFNTHSRLGLNFGILFAWAAVNSVLFPVCCYIMRKKSQHEKKREEEKKSS